MTVLNYRKHKIPYILHTVYKMCFSCTFFSALIPLGNSHKFCIGILCYCLGTFCRCECRNISDFHTWNFPTRTLYLCVSLCVCEYAPKGFSRSAFVLLPFRSSRRWHAFRIGFGRNRNGDRDRDEDEVLQCSWPTGCSGSEHNFLCHWQLQRHLPNSRFGQANLCCLVWIVGQCNVQEFSNYILFSLVF